VTLTEIEFYFLRHGETDWNRKGIFQGSTDVPLNETGFKQAGDAAEIIRHHPVKAICCSPMIRARQTAAAVAERLNIEPVVIDGLREVSVGVMEGKPKDSGYNRWRKGEITVEGAETWEDFTNRSLQGVNEALKRPGPVLIVSHGGLYQALQGFLGVDEGMALGNCQPIYMRPPSMTVPNWQTLSLG
jgi:probable phosphoglycerate mutase